MCLKQKRNLVFAYAEVMVMLSFVRASEVTIQLIVYNNSHSCATQWNALQHSTLVILSVPDSACIVLSIRKSDEAMHETNLGPCCIAASCHQRVPPPPNE